MDKKLLLTPREVAESLGLSVHTVYKAIRDGRIPSVRPLGCRTVRVRVGDVVSLAQLASSPTCPTDPRVLPSGQNAQREEQGAPRRR